MEAVAARLVEKRRGVIMTGAGISVASGVPDFRSAGGLWARFDPMEYATIEAFRTNPVKVWRMLREMDEIIHRAVPNPAHLAVAELEKLGLVMGLITQNVDNLHQRAGSREVVEFHGNAERLVCPECGWSGSAAGFRQEGRQQTPPRCPECGMILKPDVVFFGEQISPLASSRAMNLVQSCETMLVIGTSAMVAPASYLPVVARKSGAQVVEINRERTVLTGEVAHVSLLGDASEILSALVDLVRRPAASGNP